ncbi:tape measure protein [Asticcacaulis sp. SL142]|uniref:tape measure protein n=1 Tax=Asticcacaulis sp. SL142 TaxID=2995155 RepID=UPI00226D1841|nr:tape measure protein [Asticcacaulis sp. SL142]WAC49366.1 tape measure protein [Asticcacaulis sp. SL142]
MAIQTQLETQFTADTLKVQKQMDALGKKIDATMKKIANDNVKTTTAIDKAWKSSNIQKSISDQVSGLNSMSAAATRLVPALAGIVTVSKAIAANDASIRFSNSLKVAGLEGANLEGVQQTLFEQAQKNAAPLEALGSLYGKVSQSAKNLGVTQAEITDLTNTVGLALKVSGTNATAASGGLLQLSQALGSGRVQAEEYNSIIESMPSLVLAAANASSKYAGNVSALKADIISGGVSSRQFFDLLIAGSAELEANAGKSVQTVEQGMTKLTNAITMYVGMGDQSLHVSQRLGQALELIAENLDLVTAAITIGMTVAGARLIGMTVNLTAATYASAAADAAKMESLNGVSIASARTTMAMNALTGAANKTLMAFGGTVGLAITGLTVVFGALALAMNDANNDLKELQATSESAENVIKKYGNLLKLAADDTKTLGDNADDAAGKMTSFAGQTGAAAQSLYEYAKAQKAAALAEIEREQIALRSSISKNEARTPAGRRADDKEIIKALF